MGSEAEKAALKEKERQQMSAIMPEKTPASGRSSAVQQKQPSPQSSAPGQSGRSVQQPSPQQGSSASGVSELTEKKQQQKPAMDVAQPSSGRAAGAALGPSGASVQTPQQPIIQILPQQPGQKGSQQQSGQGKSESQKGGQKKGSGGGSQGSNQ